MFKSNLTFFVWLCISVVFAPAQVDSSEIFEKLLMDEVIISGARNEQTRSQSNLSISTLNIKNPKFQDLTLSALLENVPGIFIDGSIGEVQNRVHSRGVSVAAEDDIGWYYMSLMEDGLPVTMTQHTYYSPDMFFRTDRNIDKLEVIRGGQSSLLGINSPGGIFNIISKDGDVQPGGNWGIGYGLAGKGRDQVNIDVQLDGPLNHKKALYYSLGLHYRFDQGARNTVFNWSDGGQLKGNIKKVTNKAVYHLRLKYLNDVTNRYLGLPATNWTNPTAANGFDFNHTAIMLPAFSALIPDGRSNPSRNFIQFDTEKGIQTKDASIQFDMDHQLGQHMRLSIKSKYADKSARWNTMIGNQPLGLESFLPYFLTSYDNPWGQIDFVDVASGTLAASINNFGALNAFQGLEPTFDYLTGNTLPNDAVLGTGLWLKDDNASEWMNRIILQGGSKDHKWNINGFLGISKIDMYTTASYVFATYEASPRLLTATLVDPMNGDVNLSDAVGVSNYNGLFYEDGTSDNLLSSIAISDRWAINPHWTIHLGAKVESIQYKGQRYLPSPLSRPGGLDGVESSGYDNSVLTRGEAELFNDTYGTFSYSFGANFKASNEVSLFLNYAKGEKAPELNYYFNTFASAPIGEKTETQTIGQLEFGFNYFSEKVSAAIVGFYSDLDNFSANDFAFDDMTGSVFYTPFQNNKVNVVGIELESTHRLSPKFNIATSLTVQTSKATRFTVYDPMGSVDISDDKIIDYSGNKIAHTPGLILNLRPEYISGPINIFAGYRFMGSRYGNAANSFEMDGFGTLSAGITYHSGRFTIGAKGSNLLNSEGLLNFFGPDEFGSSANQATTEYINANPAGRFVVFPVLPRIIRVSLGYGF